MRILICGALLLALAACGKPDQQLAQGAPGCARSATQQVHFSDAERLDTVTARSEGPNCLQAAITLTVRNDRGDLLWVFANTYYDLTAGGAPPEDAPPVSNEDMDRFLQGLANVSMNHSGDLPEWKSDKPSLTASVEGFSYATEFERETYEMLRARNLRQLCYGAAAEASQCLVMDPATNSPIMIVAFGP